jgi:hypothetical protein
MRLIIEFSPTDGPEDGGKLFVQTNPLKQVHIVDTSASKLSMTDETSFLWIQPRLFVGVGVRLIFGQQECTYLQQLSLLHMDSNLGLLLLHGKIIKSTLRRIQPPVDTLSESVTIIDFIQRCILST